MQVAASHYREPSRHAGTSFRAEGVPVSLVRLLCPRSAAAWRLPVDRNGSGMLPPSGMTNGAIRTFAAIGADLLGGSVVESRVA
jgi:hypothetical protein